MFVLNVCVKTSRYSKPRRKSGLSCNLRHTFFLFIKGSILKELENYILIVTF